MAFTSDFAQNTWVVVKIMVPFGVLIIIRHLLFRVPQNKKGTIILTTTHLGMQLKDFLFRLQRTCGR